MWGWTLGAAPLPTAADRDWQSFLLCFLFYSAAGWRVTMETGMGVDYPRTRCTRTRDKFVLSLDEIHVCYQTMASRAVHATRHESKAGGREETARKGNHVTDPQRYCLNGNGWSGTSPHDGRAAVGETRPSCHDTFMSSRSESTSSSSPAASHARCSSHTTKG